MRKGIMLCYPFEEARFKKWGSEGIIQPKLDGDRCRAIIDSEGCATLLSSEENIIVSVPHINSALEALHLRNVELDGELYSHGIPHEDIHSIVSREVNIHPDFEIMEYHVFDIVNSKCQVERTLELRELDIESSYVKKVGANVVYSFDEVMSNYDNYISNGYEGFVLRHMDGLYQRKRYTGMMKFKPKKEDAYIIVGYQQEVDQYGNPKESLGALICQGDDMTRFNVGTGPALTRDERIKLWTIRDSLPGRIATVKYQHITTAGKVPRFPVLLNITRIK